MKLKLVLYDDNFKVKKIFEGIEYLKKLDAESVELEFEADGESERLKGIKLNFIVVPNDIEVEEEITEELFTKSIDIEHEISDKDEIKEIREQLKEATKVINEVSRQFIKSDTLTDEQKSELIGQFRNVKVGDTVHPDEVVRIKGNLYRMVQSSAITIHDESWLEDESLFTDFINPVLQEDGEDQVIVDDYVQPTGSHDAYMIGDLVSFEGDIYESAIDNNTWSPSAYPGGWKLTNNSLPTNQATKKNPKKF